MEDYFGKFIKEEYEWLYGGDDCADIIMRETGISEEEYYENLDDFIKQATDNVCIDEYIIQCLHDWMHDELSNVIENYMEPRE